MRNAIRPLLVLATASAMITSPSWAATGQNSAEIDAFLSSTTFQLVDTDVMFRFSELVSPETNTSSHILIDGLVPIEEGSDQLTSNYRGIDISTGEVFDTGQVLLTLPAGVSGDGASSPIVGIVSRPNGWDGYSPEPPPGTTVGESMGTFSFDTDAMEIDFMLTQGNKTIQGMTTYTVDSSTWTVTLAPFTLNDGTNDYTFGSTILVWDGVEYYGLIVSEDASPSYDSLMFSLRLYSPDGDGDNIPLLVDTDGEGYQLPQPGEPAFHPIFGTMYSNENTLGAGWGWCTRYGYVWVGRYNDSGYFWISGNTGTEATTGWYFYWGEANGIHYLWSPKFAADAGDSNQGWASLTESSKGFFYLYLNHTLNGGHFKTGVLYDSSWNQL